MTEPEGTREDFLRMFGRNPEPLPPEDQQPEPEPTSEPELEQVSVDPILTALGQGKPWAQAFVEMLHPPGEKES